MYKTMGFLLVFLAFVFVGLSALGIGSCVQYERKREMACLKAGGSLMFMPGANARGCVRVTVTVEPLTLEPGK